MDQSLVATDGLCYLGSGRAVETFFKEKAFRYPEYAFLYILDRKSVV